MMDGCSSALPGARGSNSNVVNSARHWLKQHTLSTAVVAALLRWLNKNTGSRSSRLVGGFEVRFVFFVLNECPEVTAVAWNTGHHMEKYKYKKNKEYGQEDY